MEVCFSLWEAVQLDLCFQLDLLLRATNLLLESAAKHNFVDSKSTVFSESLCSILLGLE